MSDVPPKGGEPSKRPDISKETLVRQGTERRQPDLYAQQEKRALEQLEKKTRAIEFGVEGLVRRTQGKSDAEITPTDRDQITAQAAFAESYLQAQRAGEASRPSYDATTQYLALQRSVDKAFTSDPNPENSALRPLYEVFKPDAFPQSSEVTSGGKGNAQGDSPSRNLAETMQFVDAVSRASTSGDLDSLQVRIEVQQDFAGGVLMKLSDAREQRRSPEIDAEDMKRIFALQGLRVGTAEAHAEVPERLQELYKILGDITQKISREVAPKVDRPTAEYLQQPPEQRNDVIARGTIIEGQWKALGAEGVIKETLQEARSLVQQVSRETPAPEAEEQYKVLRTAIMDILDPASGYDVGKYEELTKVLDVLNEPLGEFLYTAEQKQAMADRAFEERVAVISTIGPIQERWDKAKDDVIAEVTDEARRLVQEISGENPSLDVQKQYNALHGALVELLDPNAGIDFKKYEGLKEALAVLDEPFANTGGAASAGNAPDAPAVPS